MSKVREEIVALFDDEYLTSCYQFIVDEYREMIHATRRYDLCPYQYAQFVMAAVTTESNFGIFNGAENHHEVEMSILHQDIPQYAATNKYIYTKVADSFKEYLQYSVSKEFTDLWCGPLMYLNISLLEIDGTYDKPIFVFSSTPKDKYTLKRIRRYLETYHQVIVNHKTLFHGAFTRTKNKAIGTHLVLATDTSRLYCKVKHCNGGLTIKISSNKVVVCTPYTAIKDATSNLNKKVSWLWRYINNRRTAASNANTSITSAWLFGKVLQIVHVPGKLGVYTDSECIYITGAQNDKCASKLLKRYYQTTMEKLLTERVCMFSSVWRIAPTAVKLNYSNDGLGSCDQNNVIYISWRLLAAPIEVINYVIAHEIAHCIYRDHSPAFWSEVARLCPNFIISRNWFNEYIKHAPLWE